MQLEVDELLEERFKGNINNILDKLPWVDCLLLCYYLWKNRQQKNHSNTTPSDFFADEDYTLYKFHLV